jgi:hypothetical protein
MVMATVMATAMAMVRRRRMIQSGRSAGRRLSEIGWGYLIISSKNRNEGKLVGSF